MLLYCIFFYSCHFTMFVFKYVHAYLFMYKCDYIYIFVCLLFYRGMYTAWGENDEWICYFLKRFVVLDLVQNIESSGKY